MQGNRSGVEVLCFIIPQIAFDTTYRRATASALVAYNLALLVSEWWMKEHKRRNTFIWRPTFDRPIECLKLCSYTPGG